MRATRSVTQSHCSEQLRSLLAECLTVTYNAVHYAEENGVNNRRGMKGFYQTLNGLELPSCYKIACITRACAVVKSRKRSKRRGVSDSHPSPLRPVICVTAGFFITMKGRLFVPLRRDRYFDLQLDQYTLKRLAEGEVRSLTITPESLSFCYSEEIDSATVNRIFGVDRNEKNITFGDRRLVTQVGMGNIVKLRQMTREVIGSVRRNDVRIRRRLARKYWERATHRTDHALHAVTNAIVDAAHENHAALVLEDLTGITKMYRRGNGQDADYRFRLNSWPHLKAKKMLEYKSAWKGVTVMPLTKSETYGSSSRCSTCGERLRSPIRDDVGHGRMLWCQTCKVWMDRDVNAALNLSARGRSRFDRSLPRLGAEGSRSQQASPPLLTGEEGLAGEAVKGNGTTTLILRVDASKLIRRREPKS